MGRPTGRPRGWRDDPAWRHARALKAGLAARAAHAKRRGAKLGHLTKSEAYWLGYRTAANRIYRWYRLKLEQGRVREDAPARAETE